MTRSEFKAWFDGFCENIHGLPNKRQWARIQERVGEIDESEKITERIIERRDWWPKWYYSSFHIETVPLSTTPVITCNNEQTYQLSDTGTTSSSAAFRIGTVEAQQLAS
jgi:hypothetical protein